MPEYFVKKAFVGIESNLYVILTFALVGGSWSASHSECFKPTERASVIQWIGNWVGPEHVWTCWQSGRSLLLLPGIETAVQSVSSLLTDYVILAVVEDMCSIVNLC